MEIKEKLFEALKTDIEIFKTNDTDEAFVVENNEGECIMRQVEPLSILPMFNTPKIRLPARGIQTTGIIFPKEVLVGDDRRPNPYAERDPANNHILAIHVRAIAFGYITTGIPEISDWTTIFDTQILERCPQEHTASFIKFVAEKNALKALSDLQIKQDCNLKG